MKLNTRNIRRVVQVLFLLAFLAAFVVARFPLEFRGAVAAARLSPLTAVTAMIASRSFIAVLIPGLAVLGLSILFGRFFCGWVCPLGTTIDIADTVIGRLRKVRLGADKRLRRLKFAVLAAILGFALFGHMASGFLDPLALYPRTLAAAVNPYANHLTREGFDLLYQAPGIHIVSEAVYGPVRTHLLEFSQPWFRGHLLIFGVFAAILLLGLARSRFWCRYVCPLGAMLSLTRTGLLLRRRVASGCTACGKCRRVCPMGAIVDNKGTVMAGECALCGNCTSLCPKSSVRFAPVGTRGADPVPTAAGGVTRRAVIGGLAAGVVAVPAAAASARLGIEANVIRPPGARGAGEFEALCIRCGLCMKVCLTNGLQPLLLERGVAGLWTPSLEPRIGYCEYNCTLCGEACPTGAIERLEVEQKRKTAIGYAFLDLNRCLPWAFGVECLVCEEHCPVEPRKAIRLERAEVADPDTGRSRTIKRPVVDLASCIGCGVCENKCPVPGPAAILVRGADHETVRQLHPGRGRNRGQQEGAG